MKKFVVTSLVGGLTVVLPVVLLVIIFNWLFKVVRSIVEPMTILFFGKVSLPPLLEDVLALGIILLLCFAVGVGVRTRLGRGVYHKVEEYFLNIAPGYSLIKETVLQFLGRSNTPFSTVALVRVFESDTLMTAFVTDIHDDGSYSVFVPTGPNPTSGNIYHLSRDRVQLVDVPVEIALRSVISCGAGSHLLLQRRIAPHAPGAAVPPPVSPANPGHEPS